MRYVWPRLSEVDARVLLAQYEPLSPTELRDLAATDHPRAAEVAVGGQRVPLPIIEQVARDLRSLADEHGFPDALSHHSPGEFDRPAARLVHNGMKILPSDAASDEVWNFLNLVVLPDLTVWRYPDRHPERMMGRSRSTFGRLWWRAEVIGEDLLDRPDGLGEDQLVAIMERPRLAANRLAARTLAQIIIEGDEVGGRADSQTMRHTARLFRQRSAFISLESLSVAELQEFASDCLRLARELEESKKEGGAADRKAKGEGDERALDEVKHEHPLTSEDSHGDLLPPHSENTDASTSEHAFTSEAAGSRAALQIVRPEVIDREAIGASTEPNRSHDSLAQFDELPLVPAGWFPDPDRIHQYRYWDGSQWTDYVANNGVQSTSPIRRWRQA